MWTSSWLSPPTTSRRSAPTLAERSAVASAHWASGATPIVEAMSGHVAFVTGGAGGIGSAIVLALAGRGLNVAVADLDEGSCAELARETENAGVDALAVAIDVTDGASVRSGVERASGALGPVDV